MSLFKPDEYKKDIYNINYEKLVNNNVKCIVFDLDNTLVLIDCDKCPSKVLKHIKKLKKNFNVFISSNNVRKRIQPYLDALDIDGVSFSLKPLPFSLIKLRRKYKLKKEEMVVVGDQLVTDILMGKIYGIKTILVEPLGVKDLKITGLNRKIESFIIKKYESRGIFKRGRYYEGK